MIINLTGIEGPIPSDLPIINTLFSMYTMNTIVNKSLLVRDKFIPGMHLKQSGFTYSAIGPFTKNKEKIKKINKQEIQDILIETNWIKLVFNMPWLMEILKI